MEKVDNYKLQIQQWLDTWDECSVCNDMVKLKYITCATDEDKPICIDCFEEESIQ